MEAQPLRVGRQPVARLGNEAAAVALGSGYAFLAGQPEELVGRH
jgi:hypothetical protein